VGLLGGLQTVSGQAFALSCTLRSFAAGIAPGKRPRGKGKFSATWRLNAACKHSAENVPPVISGRRE